MSEQKQPAHEVILRKLKERVAELKTAQDACERLEEGAYGNGLRALGVIATLLDVLREMVIPEKEHEKVLEELHQLAGTWNKEIAAPNMLEELHGILSHE